MNNKAFYTSERSSLRCLILVSSSIPSFTLDRVLSRISYADPSLLSRVDYARLADFSSEQKINPLIFITFHTRNSPDKMLE